jgi:hypothetical protein
LGENAHVPRLLAVLAANGFVLAQVFHVDFETLKGGATKSDTGLFLVGIVACCGIAAAYCGLVFSSNVRLQSWSYLPEILAVVCFAVAIYAWLGHMG